jgi:signal transduction histidine kinase
MLSVIPLGRDTAMERMTDGLVILDAENRIVDLNPAAGKVLALPRRATIGRPAGQALAAYPDLTSLLEHETAANAEISLRGTSEPKSFQVHISPLTHSRGFKLGRLILLQDMTEQQHARELLMQQQRALARLEEREVLARELHDDIGQVLGYVKMQAQAARVCLAQDQKGAADEYLAHMIASVQETHTDVREYILGAGMMSGAEFKFLFALRQYLQQFQTNYRIRTELRVPAELRDETFEPMVQAQLLRIIQEALTNARKHARAQALQVRFQCEDSRAQIVIEDDGVGFDPALPAQNEGPRFGLRFMHERAQQVGGSVRIQSAPGRGTQVVVDVPLRGYRGDREKRT